MATAPKVGCVQRYFRAKATTCSPDPLAYCATALCARSLPDKGSKRTAITCMHTIITSRTSPTMAVEALPLFAQNQ
eukprot:962386-Rhodomonas_salina.2